MDTSQGALGPPETGRGREWTIPGAFRGDTLVSRLAASRTVRGCLPAVLSPSMWHLEREPCPRHRRSHTPRLFGVSVALLQDALEPRARTQSPPSRRTDSFTLSDDSSLVPHPSSFQAVRAQSGLNYRPGESPAPGTVTSPLSAGFLSAGFLASLPRLWTHPAGTRDMFHELE